MLPGDHTPVDGTEEHSDRTEGRGSLKSAQEILSTCDPVSRGNTIPADLISSQPLPATTAPSKASQDSAEPEQPRCDLQKPTCPRCGLLVPDHKPPPVSPGLEACNLSVHKSRSSSSSRRGRSRSRSRSNVATSHQPADACLRLLLACLWCQGAVLLRGLAEACSSCLLALCASCCHACARCCSSVREAPVEELNCDVHCHSVMFESCCEPTECLEFCLECCEICHRG